jgi:D-amino-acid oxidase
MTDRGVGRRAMLKTAGLAALGAGVSACAGRRAGSLVWPEPPRRFARVHVSEDRIIRTVVGLRPYRASGFVVRAEKIGDKTVVHNYGHGGGGITLSWGTSEMAVDEAWATGEKRFAVLGCGAVGLASARLLQQRGAEVTIYAKDLPPQTTSNIAGGQWAPTSVMDRARRSAESDALLARASRLAHRSFQRLPAAEFGSAGSRTTSSRTSRSRTGGSRASCATSIRTGTTWLRGNTRSRPVTPAASRPC